MSQQHKTLVQTFYSAIDAGRVADISPLCTETATFQFGGAPPITVTQFAGMIGAMPAGSSRHVVRDLVAEGDKLACHVDVVQGNGASTKALTLFTFSDGKIASELVILDGGTPGR